MFFLFENGGLLHTRILFSDRTTTIQPLSPTNHWVVIRSWMTTTTTMMMMTTRWIVISQMRTTWLFHRTTTMRRKTMATTSRVVERKKHNFERAGTRQKDSNLPTSVSLPQSKRKSEKSLAKRPLSQKLPNDQRRDGRNCLPKVRM